MTFPVASAYPSSRRLMASSFPVDGGIEGFTQKRKALGRKAVGFVRRCQSVDGELPLSAVPVKPTQ